MTENEAGQYSPLALAFLGDAVYGFLVRRRLVEGANMPARKLHSLTIKKVRAEYQSRAAERIFPALDDREAEIFKRGRNTSSVTVPKHASVSEYRNATALECLFGYLELCGRRERIDELFELCWNESALD